MRFSLRVAIVLGSAFVLLGITLSNTYGSVDVEAKSDAQVVASEVRGLEPIGSPMQGANNVSMSLKAPTDVTPNMSYDESKNFTRVVQPSGGYRTHYSIRQEDDKGAQPCVTSISDCGMHWIENHVDEAFGSTRPEQMMVVDYGVLHPYRLPMALPKSWTFLTAALEGSATENAVDPWPENQVFFLPESFPHPG